MTQIKNNVQIYLDHDHIDAHFITCQYSLYILCIIYKKYIIILIVKLHVNSGVWVHFITKYLQCEVPKQIQCIMYDYIFVQYISQIKCAVFVKKLGLLFISFKVMLHNSGQIKSHPCFMFGMTNPSFIMPQHCPSPYLRNPVVPIPVL